MATALAQDGLSLEAWGPDQLAPARADVLSYRCVNLSEQFF